MEIVLITSFLITLLILALPKSVTVNISDTIGIQKFHKKPTPRIGGIPIFIAFLFGVLLSPETKHLFITLTIASLPVFIGGLWEDFTNKIGPTLRMIFTIISVVIAYIWMDIGIYQLGFKLPDYLLMNYSIIAAIFTVLVVSGVVHGMNIIDGYNGLMPGYNIIVLLAISYIANIYDDTVVVNLSLILAISISGLLILNFPFGKIFIGDSGAYFCGFITTIIGLLLVSRHNELSHWLLLTLFIYPLFEVAFSIYRKKFKRKMSPSMPDGLHMHMLIYKRLIKNKKNNLDSTICNSLTSPFLWCLSLISIIPGVIWHDNPNILIMISLAFMATYIIIYRRLVRFKW